MVPITHPWGSKDYSIVFTHSRCLPRKEPRVRDRNNAYSTGLGLPVDEAVCDCGCLYEMLRVPQISGTRLNIQAFRSSLTITEAFEAAFSIKASNFSISNKRQILSTIGLGS